jgi:hypothetical protein
MFVEKKKLVIIAIIDQYKAFIIPENSIQLSEQRPV